MLSTESKFVRSFPCVGSPRISCDTPPELEIPAIYKAIEIELVDRALDRGFRKTRLTRAAVGRLFGPPSQIVTKSSELVPTPLDKKLPHSWLAKSRREAARAYRDSAIKRACCETGPWRASSLFSQKGRPASIVSWIWDSGADSEAETIYNHVRLAAAQGLEFQWAAPYPYLASHHLALELCKPGQSVLRGWGIGDTTFCEKDVEVFFPGSD